jgi:uncharacterized repeat protein (TIGR03803 family)
MNRLRKIRVAAFVFWLAATASARAQFTVLHSFTADEGSFLDGLTPSGSVLYGVASQGGPNLGGTVFRINTDGSGFAVLHSFGAVTSEGTQPMGQLVLSGSTLYGVTNQYGANGAGGTIFKINTDGSGFAVLHSFSTSNGDGWGPYSGPMLIGNVLYGTTADGGTIAPIGSLQGSTIYKINTDGTGYSVLHSFSVTGPGGANVNARLIAVGSTLYGAAHLGANGVSFSDNGYGTIFKIGEDGSGFTVLHAFTGGTDGRVPELPGLTLAGSTLYATSYEGGTPQAGALYKINTDGTGYGQVHSFNFGDTQTHDLALSGSTFYDTESRNGLVFQINTDGTGYAVLHTLTGGSNDGLGPSFSGPIIVGSTLYGTTQYGGTNNNGVIYAIAVPEPSTLALAACGLATCALVAVRRKPRSCKFRDSDGNLSEPIHSRAPELRHIY